jgi:hypothetical protein
VNEAALTDLQNANRYLTVYRDTPVKTALEGLKPRATDVRM